MPFLLLSPSFEAQGAIPAKHTCQGDDAAPALTWSDAPAGTKSFALIVDDPDAPDPRAPKTTWVHWLLYNLPATAGALPEAATAANLPPGTLEGINDWKRAGYSGPVPADRATSLFPQALRAGRRAPRSAQADQGRSREGDARPRARRGPAGRNVREDTLGHLTSDPGQNSERKYQPSCLRRWKDGSARQTSRRSDCALRIPSASLRALHTRPA